MEALMRKRVETGDAPEIVADTVLKAATDTAPRRRYTAGKLARQIRIMRRFLPESVVDKNARKYNNLPVEAELERNAPQFGLVTKRKRKLREGTALNLDERNADAQDFITVTGADFREGQGEPYYAAGRDFISMPTFEAFKDADCFYATSFHELGHWSGHKSRLDRDLTSRFGNRAYAAEELVAELASAFLCAEFGKHGECR
jgi:Zincin-like metallopeptidase